MALQLRQLQKVYLVALALSFLSEAFACDNSARRGSSESRCGYSLLALRRRALLQKTSAKLWLPTMLVGASQEVEGSSYWQGVRETGTTCFFSNCPGRLNPVACHHWRCVCQEGNKYNPADGGACVANDSPSARRMTGKTCWLTSCPVEYGSTQCVGHECVCDVGFEFQKAKGACITAPAASPAGAP